jgi:hypothetical protein
VEGLFGAWKVKNNSSKTYVWNIIKLRERSIGITETSQKGHRKKCWKERGMKHTHLDRWTCASGKWMIPRHKWSPHYRIAHGWKIWVRIYHQGTWELMKQKERRSIFIFLLLFYFLLIFLSLFFSFFFLFSLLFFSSHHIFFIFHFFLLLLGTFCNIILT